MGSLRKKTINDTVDVSTVYVQCMYLLSRGKFIMHKNKFSFSFPWSREAIRIILKIIKLYDSPIQYC